MNKREKNLLLISAAVAAVFMLLRGMPLLQDWYAERAANIELIATDVAREEQIIADADAWRERREAIEVREQDMNSLVFHEGTVPLLTASIQRMVRDLASESGIAISGASLAESLETDGWLLVQQEMSFAMDNQSNTLAFLEKLENARPYLAVSDFSMRRNRNQFAGTLTVVGFSRSAVASAGEGF